MFKKIILMAAFAVCSSPVMAAGLSDWWSSATHSSQTASKEKPTDAAQLLTLEPKEHEMFPKLSPNSRFLLTVTRKGRDVAIARRYSENGDPINFVTDDARAFDSVQWLDDHHVSYLSKRAGTLGLWNQLSAGEGMQKRLFTLYGSLTQPILLSDGSLIAVRLHPIDGAPRQRALSAKRTASPHGKSLMFNNWHLQGFRSDIVRITADDKETVLAEGGVNPALSPDGKWLAFSMHAGRSMHLFRMRIDGSDLVQLSSARSIDVQPAWTADGKSLVFTSNRAKVDLRDPKKSQWDIWMISAQGEHLQQLSFDLARDGAPVVGRDGRVYFHSDRKVTAELAKEHGLTSAAKGFHIWTLPLSAVK